MPSLLGCAMELPKKGCPKKLTHKELRSNPELGRRTAASTMA